MEKKRSMNSRKQTYLIGTHHNDECQHETKPGQFYKVKIARATTYSKDSKFLLTTKTAAELLLKYSLTKQTQL